ncbi:hypothetical protein GHK80_36785 [Sinorhizobium medicae]|nr:hypothetical protein [Sinorhizobium medicae]
MAGRRDRRTAVLHTWGQAMTHHPHDAAVFTRHLACARSIEWVVYAKPPFGGPEQVLAYLGRYTHRVAIANSRIVELDDDHVAFRWKDYRRNGCDREQVMCLHPHEFIRRFLLHLLPAGFHRMRHFGFLANSHRRDRIPLCRMLLWAANAPRRAPFQRNTRREVLRMPRLPAPHAQDRYQHSTGCSASALIVPVRYIMMPDTRYFQKCCGKSGRSPSARYLVPLSCQMGGHRCPCSRNSGQNAHRKGHERRSTGPELIAAIAPTAIPGVTTLPSDLLFP